MIKEVTKNLLELKGINFTFLKMGCELIQAPKTVVGAGGGACGGRLRLSQERGWWSCFGGTGAIREIWANPGSLCNQLNNLELGN